MTIKFAATEIAKRVVPLAMIGASALPAQAGFLNWSGDEGPYRLQCISRRADTLLQYALKDPKGRARVTIGDKIAVTVSLAASGPGERQVFSGDYDAARKAATVSDPAAPAGAAAKFIAPLATQALSDKDGHSGVMPCNRDNSGWDTKPLVPTHRNGRTVFQRLGITN